jgi:hypothetical protein
VDVEHLPPKQYIGLAIWGFTQAKGILQNGSYKMAMTREKDTLVLYKQRLEMSRTIQQYNVIPLIHSTVVPSFRQVGFYINVL